MERKLEVMLGICLLRSEYSTGPKHKGRIDTLGIDKNNSAVIIEYRRATNQNVINQGISYMDWLLDHRADFELLVLRKLGSAIADAIDWSAPRLVGVAGAFTRYDEHAVEQMNRNIELFRYRRFGRTLLKLEMVNAISSATDSSTGNKEDKCATSIHKTISEVLNSLDGPLRDLYHLLRDHILALGDDIQEPRLKYYIVSKRLRNFACVEGHSIKSTVTMYLKVDPKTVKLTPNFTSNVRNIGHYGTGDLEVRIRTKDDMGRAKSLPGSVARDLLRRETRSLLAGIGGVTQIV